MSVERPPRAESLSTAACRILLIEDNFDHRMLAQRALSTVCSHTEVLALESPLEGLQHLLAEGGNFDLIVADYRMPGMDGLAFLRRLKEQQVRTPVVMVTGLGSERVAVEALKEGAVDYLVKETGYLDLLPSVARKAIQIHHTERQLAGTRRQLAASDQRYRQLVHDLEAIVWESDPETLAFTFVSQRAESILGYPINDWLTQPEFRRFIVHPEDREHVLHTLRHCRSSASSQAMEYRALTAEGNYRWFKEVVRLHQSEEDAVLRGLMMDITDQKEAEEERKRLQQRLFQSQKLESLGTLAGGIAHDFNNLLQGILGFAELGVEECPRENAVSQYFHSILSSAERARDLTEQLLAFSRPNQPRIETVNANELVNESLRLLRRLIPATIEIRTQLQPDLWSARLDATQLQQVLVNLCLNSRDAMPDGGLLTISTANHRQASSRPEDVPASDSGYVSIVVSDTGSGIPAEIMRRIFDPFFTTKGVGKGTGLGLAVAYGIVRRHEGWIDVVSGPGHGATFSIFLPASSQPSPVKRVEPSCELVGGNGEFVLVVDDEQVVRDLASRILSGHGYRTLTACDGQQALEICRRQSPPIDLVLLDLAMPKMSGKECARLLMELNPPPKVIISSGNNPRPLASFAPVVRALAPKPYRPHELVRIVRQVLDEGKHPPELGPPPAGISDPSPWPSP